MDQPHTATGEFRLLRPAAGGRRRVVRDARPERGRTPGQRRFRRPGPASEYEGESKLIIALGASTDDTDAIAAELAAADPRVRLVPNPASDVSSGLNVAIRASRFLWSSGWTPIPTFPTSYRTAVAALRRTGAANLGGVMVAKGIPAFRQPSPAPTTHRSGSAAGFYHHGTEERPANSAYLGVFRREVLFEVGLFDETQRRGQDWELNSRLRAAGVPHPVHCRTPRESTTGRGRAWRACGAGCTPPGSGAGIWPVARARNPLRYLPPPLVAVIVIGSVVCLLGQRGLSAVRGTGSRVAGVFHVGAIGYVAGAHHCRDGPARRARAVDRLLNAAVLVIMHLSWGLGFLRGVVFGAERTVDRSRVR